MLIDIDKIVVGDRIRKDFGDIEELAEDIKENGLINPPVVNRDNVLLAGERRLRACKLLGWSRIEVRQIDTRDAEHDFDIEVSENENRKDFSKTEREAIYTKRVEARLASRVSPIGLDTNKVEREVASELGTSRTNMQREQAIIANSDLLDPAEFADWDEGKLSTNKAYQRIKAAKEQAERQRDEAREDNEQYQRDVQDLQAEIAALEKQNDELYELANTQQVVEREVVKTVAPDDYEDVKRRVNELESSNRLYSEDNKSLRKQLEAAQDGIYDHERLMDAARLEADVFRRKYSELSELAAVIAAINKFLGA